MGGLEGKVVLVTGGGRGIGRGVARGMAREGAHLAISGRTRATLEDATTELQALRDESHRPVSMHPRGDADHETAGRRTDHQCVQHLSTAGSSTFSRLQRQ
ncbi:MAG: SDR family NAD(P)-dependent oxidoreductase [Chloroflexi bacterium]|nr:SDR family NAD(P)-dependent oxidoreductase [Chloroflexota bacterium]